MKRIEVTAYHEAGHAIADLAIGRAFRYVTIEPDEDTLGHCMGVAYRGGQRLEMDAYEGNTRARAWIEKRVKVYLAGNVAERRVTGRAVVAGSRNDFTNACEMLSHLCGDYESELPAYFNLMYVRTVGLVTNPLNWLTVERIAAELLDKQTVRYRTAKELARQAQEDFLKFPNDEHKRLWAEANAYRRQASKKGAK